MSRRLLRFIARSGVTSRVHISCHSAGTDPGIGARCAYDCAVADEESEVPCTRWLDDVERGTWIPFVALMLRLPLELDRQLQRDSGLSLIEYLVLTGLSTAEDRSLRMSVLSTWTGAQLPRLSQVAGRMEAKGWIVRSPDPTDRRATLATVTEAGQEVLILAAPAHVEFVRHLVIDPLTRAQVVQLGAAATRIMEMISPGQPLPPGVG